MSGSKFQSLINDRAEIMTKCRLLVGLWQEWRDQVASIATQNSSRGRRLRSSLFSTLAAQVEQLETRELLTVTFHGGALLPHVEAQAVYLGSDWNGSALQTEKMNLDQFVSTIVNSPYMDMLTNAGYNVGPGTASAG